MSIFVRCEARREAPAPRSCENVLLRQRQVSSKVNFLLICVSEKCHFCVRMFGRYVSCEKSSVYLGDDGAKELVIIYDHLYFSRKNELTQDCF